MNIEPGWLIVCGVLTLVVGFNIGLIRSVLRSGKSNWRSSIRGVVGQIQDPWKEEDEALAELHKRVGKLRSESNEKESESG